MISSVDVRRGPLGRAAGALRAGTSAIAEVIGLGAAVDWLTELGMDAVRAHESEITGYALERLGELDDGHDPRPAGAERARRARVLRREGDPPARRVGDHRPPRRVRPGPGHHCAQPLMQHLGESATTRASFAVHTTRDEVDQLVDGLAEVRRIFA